MCGISAPDIVSLHSFLGLGWTLGCLAFGALVVRQSSECTIARRLLCQAALTLCGLAVLSLVSVTDFSTYTIFCWIYGLPPPPILPRVLLGCLLLLPQDVCV